MNKPIKRIAVITSGGDAPGMNAAVRAVVRTACTQGLEVIGFYQGYQGLIDNQFVQLHMGSMANTIQRGGTILKSGRCLDFHKPEFRKKAAENLNSIDGLVCIGGNGSFQAAHLLYKEHNIPVVGVPGTIDNDITGTEDTIGFDTAVNTALEAIDRIRDTAASHDRLFIVEVMGKNSGFIATQVALAGGAEEVFIPEKSFDLKKAIEHIKRGIRRGKKSSIFITAEGQKPGRAYDLAEAIRKKSGFEAKVCILGHIQRGGPPSAHDRILASHFGAAAVNALINRQFNTMVAIQKTKYILVPLDESFKVKPFNNPEFLQLIDTLSQ